MIVVGFAACCRMFYNKAHCYDSALRRSGRAQGTYLQNCLSDFNTYNFMNQQPLQLLSFAVSPAKEWNWLWPIHCWCRITLTWKSACWLQNLQWIACVTPPPEGVSNIPCICNDRPQEETSYYTKCIDSRLPSIIERNHNCWWMWRWVTGRDSNSYYICYCNPLLLLLSTK